MNFVTNGIESKPVWILLNEHNAEAFEQRTAQLESIELICSQQASLLEEAAVLLSDSRSPSISEFAMVGWEQ